MRGVAHALSADWRAAGLMAERESSSSSEDVERAAVLIVGDRDRLAPHDQIGDP